MRWLVPLSAAACAVAQGCAVVEKVETGGLVRVEGTYVAEWVPSGDEVVVEAVLEEPWLHIRVTREETPVVFAGRAYYERVVTVRRTEVGHVLEHVGKFALYFVLMVALKAAGARWHPGENDFGQGGCAREIVYTYVDRSRLLKRTGVRLSAGGLREHRGVARMPVVVQVARGDEAWGGIVLTTDAEGNGRIDLPELCRRTGEGPLKIRAVVEWAKPGEAGPPDARIELSEESVRRMASR